ncbi:MAG: DNA-directed RNA polymerase subunit D [Nanoarchaeota archaeon]
MDIAKQDISKDNLTISFTAKDVPVAYLNALRRAIVDYVPTLAIEDVEFRQNSSVLYDEIVAHRLGLTPIVTEPGSYTFRVEGESGIGSELKLALKAEGPGMVYAEQMESKDPKAKPVHGKMPVTKLLKGQELDIEATAILGRGIEHAKWSPGIMYYEYGAEVSVNNDAEDLSKHIERFPSEVVSDGKIDKKKIVDLGLVDACEGVYEEAVQVTYDPKLLHVTVESWGQLSAVDMVKEGIKYLEEALDDLAEAAKALK